MVGSSAWPHSSPFLLNTASMPTLKTVKLRLRGQGNPSMMQTDGAWGASSRVQTLGPRTKRGFHLQFGRRRNAKEPLPAQGLAGYALQHLGVYRPQDSREEQAAHNERGTLTPPHMTQNGGDYDDIYCLNSRGSAGVTEMEEDNHGCLL